MFLGDRSGRKPWSSMDSPSSALDNRPLQFPEFQKIPQNLLYVSATPAEYEMEQAGTDTLN